MICIQVAKKGDLIKSVKVEGHANHDTYGRDVVCACVSSASQMLVIGIADVLMADCEETMTPDPESATLEIIVNDSDLEKCQALFETYVILVELIADQYKKYVEVKYESD